MEIGGRQGVAHRVGYLHVSTVGVAGQRDLCHVPGGRVVVVIVQAVGQVKWVSVQPSWLARAFIGRKAARSPPAASLAITLAASLALGTSMA